MRLDDRIIRRLIYDGNYQRALEMIMDIIVAQNKTIEDQSKIIINQEQKIIKLEKANKLTQEVVVNPILIENQDATNLNDILKKSYEKNQ